MNESLKLLSQATLDKLTGSVEVNLERYRSGNFCDLAKENGWEIETTIAHWNPDIVGQLDPENSPEAEMRNSLLIYRGLGGMTPALAREERLWTRLCHVEFLEYARQRWLKSPEKLEAHVRRHFFALGLPASRDDNAIGRLWWNGHVASLACPDDLELGLRRLLSRANIRLQVIDRADTAFRQPLISGIVRLLGKEDWFNTDDVAVADLMFEVNKQSGGIVFEAMTDDGVDLHLTKCIRLAKERRSKSTSTAYKLSI